MVMDRGTPMPVLLKTKKWCSHQLETFIIHVHLVWFFLTSYRGTTLWGTGSKSYSGTRANKRKPRLSILSCLVSNINKTMNTPRQPSNLLSKTTWGRAEHLQMKSSLKLKYTVSVKHADVGCNWRNLIVIVCLASQNTSVTFEIMVQWFSYSRTWPPTPRWP